jgi:hypothetical protein
MEVIVAGVYVLVTTSRCVHCCVFGLELLETTMRAISVGKKAGCRHIVQKE